MGERSVPWTEHVRRRVLLPRPRNDSVALQSERPRTERVRGRARGLSWWHCQPQRLGSIWSASHVWLLPSRILANIAAATPKFGKIRGICLNSGARITTVSAFLSGFYNLSTVLVSPRLEHPNVLNLSHVPDHCHSVTVGMGENFKINFSKFLDPAI